MNKDSKLIISLLVGFFAVFSGSLIAFLIVFSNFSNNFQEQHSRQNYYYHGLSKVDVSGENLFSQLDKHIASMFRRNQELLNPVLLKVVSGITYFSGVTTEQDGKQIKITIDLKEFGGNENNVNLDIKDNTIELSAKYKQNKKNFVKSSSYIQSINLPYKVDKNSIKKEKQGNKLIIIIPAVGQRNTV